METTILIVFLAFLFGSMILILALGYQGIERERAEAEANAYRFRALEGPRFFAQLEPLAEAQVASAELALVVRHFEDHLRREHRIATEFVNQPSVARLFPGYDTYAAAMAKEFESFLVRENRSAAAFVAEPSVEGLFRDSGAGPGSVSAA